MSFLIYKYVINKSKDEVDENLADSTFIETSPTESVLTQLQPLLNNYDSKAIGDLLAPNTNSENNGNVSYLAQEWEYANNNEIRQNWIKKATSIVQLTYGSQNGNSGQNTTDNNTNTQADPNTNTEPSVDTPTENTEPSVDTPTENTEPQTESEGEGGLDDLVGEVNDPVDQNKNFSRSLVGNANSLSCSVVSQPVSKNNSLSVVYTDAEKVAEGEGLDDLDTTDYSEDGMTEDGLDTTDYSEDGMTEDGMTEDGTEVPAGDNQQAIPQQDDVPQQQSNGAGGQPDEFDFSTLATPTVAQENTSEQITIRVIDYAKLASEVEARKESILEQRMIKGYDKSDYDYQNECIDLMLEDLLSMREMPTTDLTINVTYNTDGTFSDMSIDDAIFGSDAWHDLCKAYDVILSDYTGYTQEEYIALVEVHNKEYDKWYKLFKKYYKKDKGKFHKGKSKWEPWYKRNKHNKILRDKNGKKIVNYYTVKDKHGKDWVQPAKTKWVEKTRTRDIPVPYEPETAVPNCFLGADYCQNKYVGVQNSAIKVGDGSLEHPAGVGTPIITQVLCTDNQYHDVKVTLNAYWLGESAIEYCQQFSESNRGLDPNSVIQYITYEVTIENLEDEDIIIADSEMCLCDKYQNKSPRTGFMYGFTNKDIAIAPGCTAVINDWASSTEILQKYVAWGKSFDRERNMVYFKLLAGTGNIPKYSAYKAFTGQMNESGSNSYDSGMEDTGTDGTGEDTNTVEDGGDAIPSTDQTGMEDPEGTNQENVDGLDTNTEQDNGDLGLEG